MGGGEHHPKAEGGLLTPSPVMRFLVSLFVHPDG